MNGYENAPATKMLATHCCVCARPLVDSVSVETGIGPECRKKHGYMVDVSSEARIEANRLVYSIALNRESMQSLVACNRLKELGFTKLADIIVKRVAAVKVELGAGGRYVVITPYNAEAVDAMRNIRGRRWDAERKVNTFPHEARGALFALLMNHYRGKLGIGPLGPFQL